MITNSNQTSLNPLLRMLLSVIIIKEFIPAKNLSDVETEK